MDVSAYMMHENTQTMYTTASDTTYMTNKKSVKVQAIKYLLKSE